MANEASVRGSLQILSRGILDYQSRPTFFKADVGVPNAGPTPGTFLVSVEGTDVDLSEITRPGGLCKIQNTDLTNYVTYGIFDTEGGIFLPLGEVLPGEVYPIRLSRNLLSEFVGTGTGTSGYTNTFRFKADTAALYVNVEAFDK